VYLSWSMRTPCWFKY